MKVEPEAASRPVCPTCGCRLATKRPPSQYENKGEYLRFKRKSYVLQGICTRCMKNKVDVGFKRCAECRKADHDFKVKHRQIGSKLCGCGKPAYHVSCGEYICKDCHKLELKFNGMSHLLKGKE
jgi:hypothetical protein